MMKPVLPFILLLMLAGCGEKPDNKPHALEQWVGSEVTVYFSRDLLGAAGSPIAPTSTWLNNTKLSLQGTIATAHHDGIFFDSHYTVNSGDTDLHHALFWIPMHSILTIEKKQ